MGANDYPCEVGRTIRGVGDGSLAASFDDAQEDRDGKDAVQ